MSELNILVNMYSIPIRLESDRDTMLMRMSYSNILYSRIRERMRKGNMFCSHYYNPNDIPHFVLYHNHKPLPDRFISFKDLNVHKYDTIRLEVMGLTGGNPLPPLNNVAKFHISVPYMDILWSIDRREFDVEFNRFQTLGEIATTFGAELFSRGYPADEMAGFYISLEYCNREVFIPLRFWETEYREFRSTTFHFYYCHKNSGLRNIYVEPEEYFSPWPESDYEWSSGEDYDDISWDSISVDSDAQTDVTDDEEPMDAAYLDSGEDEQVYEFFPNFPVAEFHEQSGIYVENEIATTAPFVEQSGSIPRVTILHILKRFNTIANAVYTEDYVLKLVEDMLILVHGLYNCFKDDKPDVPRIVTTIITFLKLRSNVSILSKFADSKIISFISQLLQPSEESGFVETLDSASNLIQAVKAGKKLKVTKVLYRLGMFALSLSLFDSVGINLDLLGYSEFDKELLRRKNQLTGDVILDLADGLVFLLKKGYQIILTRNIDCIYHTDDEYSQLYDDIADLKLKKVALNNPEALGFNEFWYGEKLHKTIAKLQSIVRYAGHLDKSEIRYWRNELCQLETIDRDILVAENCSKSRECPFSILFFASPGVGKSTLTKMTFQHLAKTHDLPTEDKFMYVRNPMSKYADGFKTEQHTYLLDDISFKHPAANPTGDVSLDEVYMIHGTFQYVPDQAAIEDKGRIPLRVKFLLGTTNVKDLNAYHYFSVPSAMQRRFPYIVEVEVKKEFQKDDGSGMLDATKANCLPDDYPNYWNLKVSKIIVPKNMGELAKLKHVATFRNINDYTAWLSKASIDHFDNEKIMTTSFANMRTVPICKKCYRNAKFCTCAREQSGSIIDRSVSGIAYWFALFIYYFYSSMALIIMDKYYWRIRNGIEDRLDVWGFNYINEYVRHRRFLDISRAARTKMGQPYAFGALVGVLVTFYAIFKFKRTVAGATFVEQSSEIDDEQKTYKRTDARPPAPGKFEKELTWVANDKKLCTLDLTPQILSSTQLDRSEFNRKISSNVVRLAIYDASKPKEKYVNNAIILKSNVFICNAHFFRNLPVHEFRMIVVSNELGDGVNEKLDIRFDKSLIYFDDFRDVAIFVVHAMVPKRDITSYFAKKGVYTEATGTLIGRDIRTGVVQFTTVHGVTLQDDYSDDWGKHPYKGPVTFGKSVLTTIDGDCGSMLVAHTPKGHFIASFHRAGNIENIVIGVTLYQEDVEFYLSRVNPMAVSAGAPKLAENHTIQSLHPKSVFNYIKEGTAAVYGSISDYKTNQKSRVCATPMRKYLVQFENYPVDFCAPQLKGYMPHYLAAVDLVKPTTDFNEHILKACAESFVEDILKNIPESEITELVHKYDMFTVVNGAAGVAFVDSVNRSTSTGYPHCTTKRRYLRALPPQRGLADPVEFTEEFTDEVQRMIDEYIAHRRAHPVYKETLKDEAVSLAKYLAGKTRAFGSAPICYVLIQRVYFLSLVRLIQTHKMAFECAVGVIAQTREWELFYKKLNRFLNKFAGDFKKYDKSMCPLVILLCYWILIQVNKKSGNFTEEDVDVMFGIATDTAYPFMLFNGDFVQFFGSNPSGQSLTVIINSLANCLYLRYTYVILYMENVNDGKSYYDIAKTFKDHVELFVYGDDNQGSTDLPWFNFNNIQRVFASVGITFTPPTKDDSTYEFMTIDEIDFLKRTYRYDKDLDAIVAPLSNDSINKMLTTWVASDTVSPEVQGLSVIGSAIREYFFHGRDIFEEKREMFIRLLKYLNWEHGINTTVLPTYEMLVDRYNDASDKIMARLPQHSFKLQSGVVRIEPYIDSDWWKNYVHYDFLILESWAALILLILLSTYLCIFYILFQVVYRDNIRAIYVMFFICYNFFFIWVNYIQMEAFGLAYLFWRINRSIKSWQH